MAVKTPGALRLDLLRYESGSMGPVRLLDAPPYHPEDGVTSVPFHLHREPLLHSHEAGVLDLEPRGPLCIVRIWGPAGEVVPEHACCRCHHVYRPTHVLIPLAPHSVVLRGDASLHIPAMIIK